MPRTFYLLSARVMVVALIAGSWVLALNFGSYINRMAERPADLADLAALQMQMSLLPVALGAGLAAWISYRATRGQGYEFWVTSAVSPFARVLTVHVTAIAPVLAGWSLYWAISSVQFGQGEGIGRSAAAFIISTMTINVGCALGQVVGYAVPNWLSVPLAVVVGYVGSAFFTAISDDTWWQALGPGLGAGFPDEAVAAWSLGSLLWFGGLTGALHGAATMLSAIPRRTPAGLWIASAAALIGGVTLIWLTSAAG